MASKNGDDHPDLYRTKNGQFAEGNSGGPGRPKGTGEAARFRKEAELASKRARCPVKSCDRTSFSGVHDFLAHLAIEHASQTHFDHLMKFYPKPAAEVVLSEPTHVLEAQFEMLVIQREQFHQELQEHAAHPHQSWPDRLRNGNGRN